MSRFFQVVASDILKFLEQNKSYSPMVLYGFSVGGYLWGEVMVQMAHDKEKYQNILDRFVGQVRFIEQFFCTPTDWGLAIH